MEDYVTRMGDGRRVRMTKQQIIDDIHAGMADGADAARVPELSEDEMERICEIVCDRNKIVSVEPGHEVVLSKDAGTTKFNMANNGCGVGISSVGLMDGQMIYERCFAFDSMEFAWMDYSIKPTKAVIDFMLINYEQMTQMTTMPLVMGAMPNMGLYYAPDGPHPNPTDLMREFKIEESMAASEAAADQLTADIDYICQRISEVGCEGYDFDTTNSSRSFAWNVARSAVIVKECEKGSNIPVHVNLGMGVGGIPMCELPPTDIVGRSGKILVEIANVDGI